MALAVAMNENAVFRISWFICCIIGREDNEIDRSEIRRCCNGFIAPYQKSHLLYADYMELTSQNVILLIILSNL